MAWPCIHKLVLACLQVGRAPGEVENEDVTLAIATRTRHSFVPRPPQEILQQLADQVRTGWLGCCRPWPSMTNTSCISAECKTTQHFSNSLEAPLIASNTAVRLYA